MISHVLLSMTFLKFFHNVSTHLLHIMYKYTKMYIPVHCLGLEIRVFNATFNNISAISWRSVLLVEETWVLSENHQHATSHWQTCANKTDCHQKARVSSLVRIYAPPLPYFKVPLPFSPSPLRLNIFFAYLWSFRWPNYIVTLPRYFSFRLPHLNIPTGHLSDELDKNSQRTWLSENLSHWNGYTECEKLNWEKKIEKINSLFLSWSKRNLSILGKVLIIKALIIPIFTLFVSSCVIPEKYKKEIESKCFKFIWNGKPDKV